MTQTWVANCKECWNFHCQDLLLMGAKVLHSKSGKRKHHIFARYWPILNILLHTFWKVCNKALIKEPTTPQARCYTALWNSKLRKIVCPVLWETVNVADELVRDLIIRHLSIVVTEVHCNNRFHCSWFALLVRWSKEGSTLCHSTWICGSVSGDGCLGQQWSVNTVACHCFCSASQVRRFLLTSVVQMSKCINSFEFNFFKITSYRLQLRQNFQKIA